MNRARMAAFGGAVLLVITGPAVAHAQPLSREAQAHYDSAIGLLEQRRYAEALIELEQARAFADTPKVVYNIAFCLKSLGRWAEALRAYEAVTELDLNALPALQRRFVSDSIQELRGRVAMLTVRTNVSSPNVLIGGAPASGTVSYLDLNASVVVEVRAAGYSVVRQAIRPTNPGPLVLDLELQQEAPAGPREEEPGSPSHAAIPSPGHTAAASITSRVRGDGSAPRRVPLGPARGRGPDARSDGHGGTWLWVGIGVVAAAAGAVALAFAISGSEEEPDWTVRGTN